MTLTRFKLERLQQENETLSRALTFKPISIFTCAKLYKPSSSCRPCMDDVCDAASGSSRYSNQQTKRAGNPD